MSTKTNYIGYKLITNIKKGDLLGYFLPSKISHLAYSIETLTNFVIKIRTLVVNLTHLPRPDANYRYRSIMQMS